MLSIRLGRLLNAGPYLRVRYDDARTSSERSFGYHRSAGYLRLDAVHSGSGRERRRHRDRRRSGAAMLGCQPCNYADERAHDVGGAPGDLQPVGAASRCGSPRAWTRWKGVAPHFVQGQPSAGIADIISRCAGDRRIPSDMRCWTIGLAAGCLATVLASPAHAQTQISSVCGVTGSATAPASLTYDPFSPADCPR